MHKNYKLNELLDNMADDIIQLMKKKNITQPYMVGIHTAGVWVAQALHQRLVSHLKLEPLGTLNSSYYRDDFDQRGLNKQTEASQLLISLEGRHLILVDDILFTGRTTRAAINELFDYGRLASLTLAVLIDRGGRELPVEAQIIGLTEKLTRNQSFKLINPDDLTLEIRRNND